MVSVDDCIVGKTTTVVSTSVVANIIITIIVGIAVLFLLLLMREGSCYCSNHCPDCNRQSFCKIVGTTKHIIVAAAGLLIFVTSILFIFRA